MREPRPCHSLEEESDRTNMVPIPPAPLTCRGRFASPGGRGFGSIKTRGGGGGGGGNNISSRSQYQRYDGVREVDVGVNRSNYSHRRRGRSKGRASMGDDRSMYGNIDDPPLTRAESLLHRSGLRNGGRSRY
mmetsp:Transcript_24832/g.53764  ORF Transcript_24832/g.53764 Transcript_24832/m.53764 type:complete len:132 (+) Transcript_24832:1-396(+)